jgi:chemotaxis protein methyltransferase CheR
MAARGAADGDGMTGLEHSHELTRFRAIVTQRLGLLVAEPRMAELADTLGRRIAASGLSGAHYLDRLQAAANREELRALARELTVTETYFFRNGEQFKALAEVALPARLAAQPVGRPVRILSAGCASGEEPYSLAIAVREGPLRCAERVAINAFDLNPAMLEKAARAQYSQWALREMPDALQARWFEPAAGMMQLVDAIRGAVVFEERNLAVEDEDFWQSGRFDIVFCRNMLMYFSPEQAQAAVARLARALVPGGYLFLGHAETLRGLSGEFHLCHTHDTFYYCRRQDAIGAVAPAAAAPALDGLAWTEAIRRASERIDVLAQASLAGRAAAPAAAAEPDLHGALDLHNRGQFDRTLAHLGALPPDQARDPDVMLLKAVSLSQRGQWRHAEAVCAELLERDELNAGAHYVLALCHEGTGNAQGALEHNQTAAYIDPGFAMPRLHMGLIARRLGEGARARRELGEALTLLQREDSSRLLLFGGGFPREALVALCRAELAACAGTP